MEDRRGFGFKNRRRRNWNLNPASTFTLKADNFRPRLPDMDNGRPPLQQPDMEEYSASSTTIKFDHPIPLLRGPVPAGPHDDTSNGPYLLAFRSPQSWAAAYKHCESKIISQCEEGARIGCAINASKKCQPPWWQNLMGRKPPDLKEREDCEVREMKECFGVAKGKCEDLAKQKLLKPFGDARISGRVTAREAKTFVCLASLPERSTWRDLIGLDALASGVEFGVTNYRASELLGDTNYESFLK